MASGNSNALRPFVRAGTPESEDEEENGTNVVTHQRLQISRGGRARLIRTTQQVIEIPEIITPLWQITLGRSYNGERAHSTYKLHEGSYGPYEDVLIKEAPRHSIPADHEIRNLSAFAGNGAFQQIRGVGVTSTKIYIAVDKCGSSVKSYLDSLVPIPQEILPIIYCELIKALKDMSDLGYVHRDLNCSNIYLSSLTSDVKVSVGGLKFAKNMEGSRLSLISRRSDIPIDRLVYRYHGYDDDSYNWRTELFLVAAIMNALLNGSELRMPTAISTFVRPPRNACNYIGLHVMWLNKVLMLEEFSHIAYNEVPIAGHYLFWDLGKGYLFICSCYELLEGMRVRANRGEPTDRAAMNMRLNLLKDDLEHFRGHLFSCTWAYGWSHVITSRQVRLFLDQNGVTFRTVFSIIATFRNRGAHHYEDQDDVRSFFGALPDQYMWKWLDMFPSLLAHMVRWAIRNELHFDQLETYFENPHHEFWAIVGETPLDDYEPQRRW